MKRLNPDTGEFFKQGDIRDDACRFWSYKTQISKKTGYFYEVWRTWENYEKELNNNKHRVRKFYTNNPAIAAANGMKRYAAKLKRTPPWLTVQHFKQIENMYERAKIAEDFTGKKHHVDHIEPLQGKNVSGLHVPWNLQVMTASENISKGNRRVEEKPTPSVPDEDYWDGEIHPQYGVIIGTGTRKDDDSTDDTGRAV
jgi:hypothetical protein